MTRGLFDLDHPKEQTEDSPITSTRRRSHLSVSQLQTALRIAGHVPDGSLDASPATGSSVGQSAGASESDKAAAILTAHLTVDETTGLASRHAGAQIQDRLPRSIGMTVLGWVGGQQLVDSLRARAVRRAASGTPDSSAPVKSDPDPHISPELLAATDPQRESARVRLTRWVLPAAAVVVLLVGLLTITARVVGIVSPSRPQPMPTSTTDIEFAGAAETTALHLFTWDTKLREARAAAIARWELPAGAVDGWDGSGVLTAESASTIAVLRTTDTQAMATVMVRVRAAAGSASWWVTVGVSLRVVDGAVRPAAFPALIGEPPTTAEPPAVPNAGQEDADLRDATAGTIAKLVTAYGSGDLEFVRAAGPSFRGLDGVVTGGQVRSWRVRTPAPGADSMVADGDLTVAWTLQGGAGSIVSGYRVSIVNTDGRWLLANIAPAVGPLS